MFCILVSNFVFRGTIPFDKTRQKTDGFDLHGSDAGDVGNPRGTGWSGQVRSTNTARPERGCGPKPNGLRGFVSRREWCHGLRSSGDVAETSAYLVGIGRDHGHHHACGGPPKAPSPASWRSRIAEGHRATTGTSAGYPNCSACFNGLGWRRSAERDEGDRHASISHQGPNLAPHDRCASDRKEGSQSAHGQ